MIDRTLRCSCKRFAYADAFSGEYGEDGYTCSSCIKALNADVIEKWKAHNAESTRYVSKEQTARGFRDLNELINPLVKLKP